MTVKKAIDEYVFGGKLTEYTEYSTGHLKNELIAAVTDIGAYEWTFDDISRSDDKRKMLKSVLRNFVLSQQFCIREYVAAAVNEIFYQRDTSDPENEKMIIWGNKSDRILTANDFFSPDEIRWKLLKHLQSGDDDEAKNTHKEIAVLLSISDEALRRYINQLYDPKGFKLFDADIRMDQIRPEKNTYDNTIHPIFMALNLTEVCFLTVILQEIIKIQREDFNIFTNMVENIANDIFSQLSDYARDIVKMTASEHGVKLNTERQFGYHPERHDGEIDAMYLIKAFGRCKIKLADTDEYIIGKFKHGTSNTVFITDDGTEMDLSGRRIVDVRRYSRIKTANLRKGSQ